MTSPYRIERERGTKESRSNSRCSGRNGRSHFRSSSKTSARWRWAPPTRSPQQWAGRFPTRSACLAAGKWRRSTANPYFPMTRLPGRNGRRRGEGPGGQALAKLAARKAAKKAAEAAAPAVVKPKHAPAPPTKRRSHCVTGCVQGCCADIDGLVVQSSSSGQVKLTGLSPTYPGRLAAAGLFASFRAVSRNFLGPAATCAAGSILPLIQSAQMNSANSFCCISARQNPSLLRTIHASVR